MITKRTPRLMMDSSSPRKLHAPAAARSGGGGDGSGRAQPGAAGAVREVAASRQGAAIAQPRPRRVASRTWQPARRTCRRTPRARVVAARPPRRRYRSAPASAPRRSGPTGLRRRRAPCQCTPPRRRVRPLTPAALPRRSPLNRTASCHIQAARRAKRPRRVRVHHASSQRSAASCADARAREGGRSGRYLCDGTAPVAVKGGIQRRQQRRQELATVRAPRAQQLCAPPPSLCCACGTRACEGAHGPSATVWGRPRTRRSGGATAALTATRTPRAVARSASSKSMRSSSVKSSTS